MISTLTLLTELGKLGDWFQHMFSLFPAPVKAVMFLLFAAIVFFSVLRMVH